MFFRGNCNPCDIKYIIDSDGQYLYCHKCQSRFPNATSLAISKELYPNIHQVLINFTINNNNYGLNEFDETLDYNIDREIFEDEQIWYLVNSSINGCKSSDIAELLKMTTENFVFDIESELWYYFTGFKWIKDSNNLEMYNYILNLYDMFYIKVKTYYRTIKNDLKIIKCINNFESKLKKPALKKEIVEESKRIFVDRKFHRLINSKYHLLAFTNGLYDFKTHSFRKTQKDDFIEINVDYDYDPTIKNPLVWKFICQILPDENIRNYVLKCFSNCLNGRNSNSEMLLLIGSGSNGKTQLLNLMLNTLGDYGEKLAATLLTKPRKEASEANPELAKLIHKRFAFVSEPEHGQSFNISQLKELTGNEKIVARGLYKESKTFPMITHFFLACNQLPTLPKDMDPDDESLTRRLRVIDFPSRFVKNPENKNEYLIDHEIPITLEEDITWRQTMMNILLSYTTKDIDLPESVLLRTQNYKNEQNEYLDWIRENLHIVNDDTRISLKEICDTYKQNMKQSEKTLLKRYIEKEFNIDCNTIKINNKAYKGFQKLQFK